MMDKLKPCPFCGRTPFIHLADEEGNLQPASYAEEPFSMITYVLCHYQKDNDDMCPIATYEGDVLGTWLYESEEEAVEAWNRRA